MPVLVYYILVVSRTANCESIWYFPLSTLSCFDSLPLATAFDLLVAISWEDCECWAIHHEIGVFLRKRWRKFLVEFLSTVGMGIRCGIICDRGCSQWRPQAGARQSVASQQGVQGQQISAMNVVQGIYLR